MKKLFCVLALLFLVTHAVFSQTFLLEDLQGKTYQLKVKTNYPDNLMTAYINDSAKICVDQFTGFVGRVHVLQKKFLVMDLNVRGGSGVSLHQLVLLCIVNGKLCNALTIFSRISSIYFEDTPNKTLRNEKVLKNDYFVAYKTLLPTNKGYRLTLEETEMHKIDNKMNGKIKHHLVSLEFDHQQNIFCNKGKIQKIQYINSDTQVVLNQITYLFKEGVWYLKREKGALDKLTADCYSF